MSTKEKYLNPFTDFGFKKLFGSEVNTDILINFLNAILPENVKIINLKYLKTEHIGHSAMDRKVVYDVYCENQKGEKFIVELQKARQKYFKERTIFYSTFPIQEQAIQGDWNFNLKAIYTVSILDFLIDDNSLASKKKQIKNKISVKKIIKLMDIDTKEIFYDKLTYVQINIPLFIKEEHQLETVEDKWFYIIRNLQRFQNRPAALEERIFDKVFETAEIAMFDKQERMAYEDSLKSYRDIKNVIDTAIEDKAIKMAISFIKKGYPFEDIADGTELSLEEVQKIANSLNL
jgi:predicted transposase/invertase (TIGR01784 family)